jgi:2'-5' RNA ligase
MIRAFIGIKIPEEITEKIDSFSKEKLKNIKNIKRVEKENLHITLKFLGEITEDEAEKLKEELKKISFVKFQIKIKGIGVFPSISNPKVIWIGGESEKIQMLKREIDLCIKNSQININQENDKPFVIHITIGRIKKEVEKESEKIKQLIKENLEFGEFSAEEFILFQSVLTPNGPIYKVLEKFPLL